MDDRDIVERIGQLVDEEHRLEGGGAPLGPEEQSRIRDLEVQLDQCWDLLRQRRARRGAGLDPDGAGARDGEVVERYQQ